MKAATFLLAGCVLLLSACSNSETDNDPPQKATSAHVSPRVIMSDYAAGTCANAGGTLALSRQLDGSSVGMCQMANGRRCSENALTSGTCAH